MRNDKKTTWPPDPMLDYLERKFPAVKITVEDYMDCAGVPREEWEAEMIADMPPQFRRCAERLAERARRQKSK